jgi:flagellar biosynthesis/type III secretory pathway M-ring protein FliF/YscJ
MDLLRNLFGNVTSGIIRLAVAAGVLFLCYLFIVKPVLKTTSEVTDKAFKSSGLDEISKTIKDVNVQVRRQIHHSFEVSKQSGGGTQKLVHCIKRSNGDVQKIQRCTRRF